MSPTVCFSVVEDGWSRRSLTRGNRRLVLGLNKLELEKEDGNLFGLDFSTVELCGVVDVEDKSLLINPGDLSNLFFDLNLSRKLSFFVVLVDGSVVESSISLDTSSALSCFLRRLLLGLNNEGLLNPDNLGTNLDVVAIVVAFD